MAEIEPVELLSDEVFWLLELRVLDVVLEPLEELVFELVEGPVLVAEVAWLLELRELDVVLGPLEELVLAAEVVGGAILEVDVVRATDVVTLVVLSELDERNVDDAVLALDVASKVVLVFPEAVEDAERTVTAMLDVMMPLVVVLEACKVDGTVLIVVAVLEREASVEVPEVISRFPDELDVDAFADELDVDVTELELPDWTEEEAADVLGRLKVTMLVLTSDVDSKGTVVAENLIDVDIVVAPASVGETSVLLYTEADVVEILVTKPDVDVSSSVTT